MEMKQYLQQVEALYRKLAINRQKLLRTQYRQYHITDMQYQVLAYIDEHPGTSIGMLAKSLHQDPGNMSALCKKLEQSCLLARQKKPEDERSVSLYLCEKGMQCVREISALLTTDVYKRQPYALSACFTARLTAFAIISVARIPTASLMTSTSFVLKTKIVSPSLIVCTG